LKQYLGLLVGFCRNTLKNDASPGWSGLGRGRVFRAAALGPLKLLLRGGGGKKKLSVKQTLCYGLLLLNQWEGENYAARL
jgi:hypothetical protein